MIFFENVLFNFIYLTCYYIYRNVFFKKKKNILIRFHSDIKTFN